MLMPPALTLVLTFRFLAFVLAALRDFAADLGLFMFAAPGVLAGARLTHRLMIVAGSDLAAEDLASVQGVPARLDIGSDLQVLGLRLGGLAGFRGWLGLVHVRCSWGPGRCASGTPVCDCGGFRPCCGGSRTC